MIGTVEEVNVDLLMAALSAVITQRTDGDEQKQERLRRARRLRVEIEAPSTVDEKNVALAIHCYLADEDDEPDKILFTVTDDRERWKAWTSGLGLRTQEGRTSLGREPEE